MQGAVQHRGVRAWPRRGFTQAAREHFGALTPLRAHRSPAQAIAEVSAGRAAVAVLPLPSETEPPRDAWWTCAAAQGRAAHPHRRPPAVLGAAAPEGAPDVQALVVAAVAPDPCGADRSLLGLELDRGDEPRAARRRAATAAAGLGQRQPGG